MGVTVRSTICLLNQIRRETVTLGTAELEESGLFVDIEEDEDELEENEFVLEDC